MQRRYVYKKGWLRYLMGLVDSLGSISARRNRPKAVQQETTLIIRLDQIGDIVLSEPFLTTLKKNKPNCRILCVTTDLGKALFKSLEAIDEIITFNPSWFSKKRNVFRQLCDLIKLVKLLRCHSADLIIDLRGDVRHIVASRLAQPEAYLLSYGIGGGGFLCDVEGDYPWTEHEVQKNLKFLEYIGGTRPPKVQLSSNIASDPLPQDIEARVNQINAIKIVLHVGSHAPSKQWPLAYWSEFAGQFMEKDRYHLFWIGDHEASRRVDQVMKKLNPSSLSSVTNFCGLIPLESLGHFLKRCDLLLSVDSGPVHIAAAQQLKTVVLFSGTAPLPIWRPLNDHLAILNQNVPCAPCYRTVCNQVRHDCMEGIQPATVYQTVTNMLYGR